MKTRLLYLLSFAAALTLTGCPNTLDCLDPDPKYAFDITGSFTPYTDRVKVGDTIYLESNFPSTLTPVGSTDPMDYTGAENISNVLIVFEYLPNQPRRDAVYDFDFISIKGEAYNTKDVPSPERAEQLRYEEIADSYELKIAIIPKKKGNYMFGLSGAYSDGRMVNGEKRCDRASFIFKLSNDQQENYARAEAWARTPIGNNLEVYAFTVY
jgi:hypothetical protein